MWISNILGSFGLYYIRPSRYLKDEWRARKSEPAKLCWFSSHVEDLKTFSASSSSAVVDHFEKHMHILYTLILGEHKYNHQRRTFSRSSHGKSWSHSEIFVSLECSVVNSSSESQPD